MVEKSKTRHVETNPKPENKLSLVRSLWEGIPPYPMATQNAHECHISRNIGIQNVCYVSYSWPPEVDYRTPIPES